MAEFIILMKLCRNEGTSGWLINNIQQSCRSMVCRDMEKWVLEISDVDDKEEAFALHSFVQAYLALN